MLALTLVHQQSRDCKFGICIMYVENSQEGWCCSVWSLFDDEQMRQPEQGYDSVLYFDHTVKDTDMALAINAFRCAFWFH